MFSRLHIGSLFFLSAIVFGIFLANEAAANGRNVEDFSTQNNCNVPATTAWWDTGSGTLRLHPFAPTLAGRYDTPGTAAHVVVAGDYAYVADGELRHAGMVPLAGGGG
jgi:hypothetical protein